VSLARLQAGFQAYILASPDDPGPVLSRLQDGPGMPRARRAAIYHHAYRARLQEALGSVFERTWAYVGDEEFAAAGARYIESNPPATRNLRDYGAGFPASLREAMPADPEAAELATMDWNLHVAFDSPDDSRLDPADLARLGEADWMVARLAFHRGVSMAVFEWNVLEVWHALDQGRIPPPARRMERPVGHLFWRSGLASRFRSLDDAEFDALRALAAGSSFASVCERTAPEQAGAWLRAWIRDELLTGVYRGD
jgi:hypothetical protein